MSSTSLSKENLSREELYDLVWSTPMQTLAARFGISDRALAKYCRRRQVPVPGIGYRAKLSAGKPGKKPPLSPFQSDHILPPGSLLPREVPPSHYRCHVAFMLDSFLSVDDVEALINSPQLPCRSRYASNSELGIPLCGTHVRALRHGSAKDFLLTDGRVLRSQGEEGPPTLVSGVEYLQWMSVEERQRRREKKRSQKEAQRLYEATVAMPLNVEALMRKLNRLQRDVDVIKAALKVE